MNERQEKILSAVIEEYTQTAIPVGSQILVGKYEFKVSPATIRNDMMNLEEEGYLYQPHISAGRIPTDKGYRYFVEKVMKDKELSKEEQQKMQREFLKLKAQNTRLTRTTAKLLSHVSGNFAISSITESNEFADFGMRELMEAPEFKELDDMCRLVEMLDYVDEKFDKLTKDIKEGETRIFIGKENPIEGSANCSMMVSPYRLSSGEKGILAIIGPKRMEYAKNKSMIEYVKKLLGASMVIIMTVNVI
ncbi:MAG: Transcriptional regulator of heat shock protein [uncultured bacterium]|nr:MAG: Transcriptional regulator of heat shock protein [uncultured bacterium]